MDRIRFHKRLKPLFKATYDHYSKHGRAAVRDAYVIAWLKHAEYRLTVETDDRHDDVPFFDEVDPKWFFKELVDEAKYGDNSCDIFVDRYDTSYEYWEETLKLIEDLWRTEQKEKASINENCEKQATEN